MLTGSFALYFYCITAILCCPYILYLRFSVRLVFILGSDYEGESPAEFIWYVVIADCFRQCLAQQICSRFRFASFTAPPWSSSRRSGLQRLRSTGRCQAFTLQTSQFSRTCIFIWMPAYVSWVKGFIILSLWLHWIRYTDCYCCYCYHCCTDCYYAHYT